MVGGRAVAPLVVLGARDIKRRGHSRTYTVVSLKGDLRQRVHRHGNVLHSGTSVNIANRNCIGGVFRRGNRHLVRCGTVVPQELRATHCFQQQAATITHLVVAHNIRFRQLHRNDLDISRGGTLESVGHRDPVLSGQGHRNGRLLFPIVPLVDASCGLGCQGHRTACTHICRVSNEQSRRLLHVQPNIKYRVTMGLLRVNQILVNTSFCKQTIEQQERQIISTQFSEYRIIVDYSRYHGKIQGDNAVTTRHGLQHPFMIARLIIGTVRKKIRQVILPDHHIDSFIQIGGQMMHIQRDNAVIIRIMVGKHMCSFRGDFLT